MIIALIILCGVALVVAFIALGQGFSARRASTTARDVARDANSLIIGRIHDHIDEWHSGDTGCGARLKRLECFAGGGHKHVYAGVDDGFYIVGNTCYPSPTQYIFRCACGHEVKKTAGELTTSEMEALYALGLEVAPVTCDITLPADAAKSKKKPRKKAKKTQKGKKR